MRIARLANIAPEWVFTQAGAILLIAVLVNLGTSFANYTHSITLPSMEAALHLSHTEAGLLITMASVARMGSTMASGTLAPRYGSRVIIGGGVIGGGASMVLLGLSPNYAVAAIAMVLMGLTSGAAITPMMGLLAGWFAVRTRGLAAGFASAGGSAAFIVAGAIVPFLVARSMENGWRHTWEGLGVMVVIIGLAALAAVKEPSPSSKDGAASARSERSRGQGVRSWPIDAYKTPLVWLVTLLAFTSGWSNSIFSTFFGVYLSNENAVSLATVGQLLITIGVLSVGSGVVWGRLSDRMGRAQAFLLSFVLQGTSFALFAFLPGMGSFIVSSVIMGLTLRATYTICAASAGDYVPVQYSSAAFALMAVGAGLGSTVSPALGGVVADSVGMNWSFASAMGGSVVGMAGSVWLLSVRHGFQEQAELSYLDRDQGT